MSCSLCKFACSECCVPQCLCGCHLLVGLHPALAIECVAMTPNWLRERAMHEGSGPTADGASAGATPTPLRSALLLCAYHCSECVSIIAT